MLRPPSDSPAQSEALENDGVTSLQHGGAQGEKNSKSPNEYCNRRFLSCLVRLEFKNFTTLCDNWNGHLLSGSLNIELHQRGVSDFRRLRWCERSSVGSGWKTERYGILVNRARAPWLIFTAPRFITLHSRTRWDAVGDSWGVCVMLRCAAPNVFCLNWSKRKKIDLKVWNLGRWLQDHA